LFEKKDQAWWFTTVIPATPKVEIERIVVQGQPRQKASKTPISTNKLSVVVCTVIPAIQEAISRRIMSTLAREKM
jgi:hypothetical protein